MTDLPVFELDVDDDAMETPVPEQVTIRLAGRVYTATRPKDAVWAEMIAAGRQGSTIATRLHGMLVFLDTVFGPEQADELARRYRDPKDELNYSHLALARQRLEQRWKDWLEERFAAIGLLMEGESLEADMAADQLTQESATETAKKATPKKPRAKR